MQTGQEKFNYPPQVQTLGTSDHQIKKKKKCFKVFSFLEQYIQSIEQIRLIDQLMRPISKAKKEETLKRVNAILLEIKQQLDDIEGFCHHFVGKEEMFVEAQLITLGEWKGQIKKIDKAINGLLNFINANYPILASVYFLQTKIFNVGSIQWRRKCENILKDAACFCLRV